MTKLTDQQVFDSARDYMLGGHKWTSAKERGGNGYFDNKGTPCALMQMIGAKAEDIYSKGRQIETQDKANNLYYRATGRTTYDFLEMAIMRIYDEGYSSKTEPELMNLAKQLGLNFDSIDESLWTEEDAIKYEINRQLEKVDIKIAELV